MEASPQQKRQELVLQVICSVYEMQTIELSLVVISGVRKCIYNESIKYIDLAVDVQYLGICHVSQYEVSIFNAVLDVELSNVEPSLAVFNTI